jgi:hypothetical protein
MLDFLALFHSAPFPLMARCAYFPRIIELSRLASFLRKALEGNRKELCWLGSSLALRPIFESEPPLEGKRKAKSDSDMIDSHVPKRWSSLGHKLLKEFSSEGMEGNEHQ